MTCAETFQHKSQEVLQILGMRLLKGSEGFTTIDLLLPISQYEFF